MCSHGLATGCVVHHRTDLYEPYEPPKRNGLDKVRAMDVGDQAHLVRIVQQRRDGIRPAPYLHSEAPGPRPQVRPQAQDKVRINSNRLTAPSPKQAPQWQPQLDAQAARKAEAAARKAEKQRWQEEAIDLTPSAQLRAQAARLGVQI